MTLKTPLETNCSMPMPVGSSRPHAEPASAQNPFLPRKQHQDHESESEKHHGAPADERGAEQASVMGEAERPPPPSEKPQASPLS